MALANIPKDFSSRYLNDGFSGGEKKRMEILQLALLRPEIAVLDETDSGLDIDALRTVAEGVNKFAGPDMGVLIITHYQRILHMVKPDFVHVMFEGRIVKEGGPELVGVLEEKGYGWIREEVEAAPPPDLGSMEPTTTERSSPAPSSRSRRSAPRSRRSSGRSTGSPVAYLDSGASAQRVLASIQAVDRYERAPPLQRPPRLAHALGRGDRRLRGSAGDGRRPPRRRRPARGGLRPQRDRGDQPGRPGLGRRQRRRRATGSCSPRWSTTPTSSPGSSWPSGPGRRSTGSPVDDDGPARHGRLRRAARARAEARRRHPRLQRARHREPARRDLAAGPRRRGAGPRRRRPGSAEAAARRRRARRRLLRAHRPQALRADRDRRALGAGSTCCGRCRPSSAAAR